MVRTVPVDGQSLDLEGFLAVVRGGARVQLPPEARSRVEASRRDVEGIVARGAPVYGVTTGFGALSNQRIDPSRARELQHGLIASHASGVGPALGEDVVRGMILLRANSLARGQSGVRPEVIERLLDLLNDHLTPRVPERGSVGASGDLAPLAHLALALTGEGEFVGPDGRIEPAMAVLNRAGIPPLELREKEGLGLVNGTALMTSYLALGVDQSRALLEASMIAAGITFDALQGSPECFDDRLGEARNAPEERAISRSMRSLLAGSELAIRRTEWIGQDPYTLRCIPQVLATVGHALQAARAVLDGELNATTDNPLLLQGEFVNGGNFHGQSLAWAMDSLALAIHTLGAFSERRISRLVHPALNRGLPAFLAPAGGLQSGFMIPQTVAAALVNENATLAHPASAQSIPTSADQEDFVSMGAWAGAKLHRILGNARRIVAIEWIVAGQALELRRPRRGGRGSEAALAALRFRVGPWTKDHSPSGEIELIADAIGTGTLLGEVPFERAPRS